MKKYLKGALAVSLAALLMSLGGVAVMATEAEHPERPNGGIIGMEFIGVRKYLLRETASATQIVSDDQGLLYGICRMSSALGDYVVGFDYYTADTLTALISGMSTAHDIYIMSPYVYTDEEGDGLTYTQAESVRACWFPPFGPVRFESGLVGKNNSDTGYSLFFYRTDAGSNPY